jgi:hypothetical protein
MASVSRLSSRLLRGKGLTRELAKPFTLLAREIRSLLPRAPVSVDVMSPLGRCCNVSAVCWRCFTDAPTLVKLAKEAAAVERGAGAGRKGTMMACT